jgi:perosamine synthetase
MAVQPARIVFPPADRQEVSAAITDILASGVLTLGPFTHQFEDAFAAAHGSSHAVATSSGTAALEILLRSVDVAGRDVIVPANTFYATAAAVLGAGARPVFADIDAASLALSPATLAEALTPDTAAVVLVHIGGTITAHADDLRAMCADRGIALIEDAAHAHGSTFGGRFAGSFGAAAAFSFYPTKVVTCGEGGMILTESARLAQEARIYRDQGKGSFGSNHHVRRGYAWRMSELHAAVGLVHLRRMREAIDRRREVAARYDAELAALEVLRPLGEPEGCRGNVYKYIAVLAADIDRAWFKEQLASKYQVRLSGEVYDLPLHKQPVFADYAAGLRLPVAEQMCASHICLPVHSDMSDAEVDEVLDAVAGVAAQATSTREPTCASR